MIHARIRRGRWSFALLLAATAYAQTAEPTFPNPGRTSISRDNQHAMGMETAAQVYHQMPVLPDYSEESQYIRQLGRKLVATIPKENSWPFEFHVIPDKQINAFALPGGQMFINVGTITSAANEAELAGVMGHEMGHVYMQHSAKQASKAQTTSMLASLAAGVLGGTVGGAAGGLVGQLGQMGIQMTAEGLMLKYSRNDETQADAVGAIILHKAGYNPQSMVDFFKTMGAKAGAAPPQLFSSHPNPGNRQEAIKKQIAKWPVTTDVGDSASFEKVRAHALTVKTYSPQEMQAGAKSGQWAALNKQNGAALYSPGEGTFPTRSSAPSPKVSVESVAPSQKARTANLGPMKINHPDNWQVTLPEERGQFVTIAHAAGVTNRGVGYGVLLNGVPAPEGQPMSIDAMTTALITHIQKSNELEQLGASQPITVGGVEARSTFLRSPSPFPDANGQTQQERDWLVTVPMRDGSLIFMIFVAPQTDFDRLQPLYQAMVKSVVLR